MPSADYSEATRVVAGEAEREGWVGYAEYCRLREQGLRSRAFEHLTAFLESTAAWPFEPRREFVAWLCRHLERPSLARMDFMPHPLAARLVAPTLEEWTTREPPSPLPHRWIGFLLSSHTYVGVRAGLSKPSAEAQAWLRRAIELDPSEQPARIRLVELLVGGLDYDAHHLPDYYIGDAAADLRDADDASVVIGGVTDADVRARLRAELAAARCSRTG